MGLFERTHLSDKKASALCRGPSRGLHGDGLLESTAFCSGRSQGGPLVRRSRCELEKSAMPRLELGDLFFDSGSPGLVFSTTYLRGSFAPSAFPSPLRQAQGSGLRFPPLISREKTAASRQSLRKDLLNLTGADKGYFMTYKLFAKWKAQGEACPPFCRRGMGLFERTHLSDKKASALCRGPSRGLHGDGLLESTAFCSGRSQGGPLVRRSRCELEKSAMPSLFK